MDGVLSLCTDAIEHRQVWHHQSPDTHMSVRTVKVPASGKTHCNKRLQESFRQQGALSVQSTPQAVRAENSSEVGMNASG